MNRKTLISLAVTAAFASPVWAQGSGTSLGTSPGPDSMKPADSMVTPKSESSASAATGGFSAVDKNRDGYISRDEALGAQWANRFSEIDKDNDGRISKSEFEATQGAARGATAKKAEKPKY